MQTQPTNDGTESTVRRRLIGFFMFPIALFPFLALISYNWRDISALQIPPEEPTSNLFGAVGCWFSYYGYQLIGLAIWTIPLLCVFVGILLVVGKPFRIGRRAFGVLLSVISLTCLLQLAGHTSSFEGVLRSLNIVPNAGGAVGYLLITRGLAPLLSRFGSGVLMLCLLIFSVLLTIGFRNLVSIFARITAWASDTEGEEEDDPDAPEAEDQQGDSLDAALTAREEAKAQRLAEKQRIAAEKAKAKAEKEAARVAARDELNRQREEQRLKKEAEQRILDEERERQRKLQQADFDAFRDDNGGSVDWFPAREAPSSRSITPPPTPTEEQPSDSPAAVLPTPEPAQPPTAASPTQEPAQSPMAALPSLEPAQVPETDQPTTEASATPPVPPRLPPAATPAQILPVRSINTQPPPLPPVPAMQPAPPSAGLMTEEEEDKGPYLLPPVTLLHDVPPKTAGGDDPAAMAQRLIDTLKVFDVNAQLAYHIAGPVVTQYALTLDLGTRVEKVAGLQRNIQMALQATSLRIEAPIPGKNAVGIEVPNAKPASVSFREIFDGELWQQNSPGKFQVPLLLGKDAAGNDLVADLAKLPHLLVAGATGQGKSVCLNSIINGLLMCRTPEQLKLIMVDPKRVEFTSYNKLPHLLVPIINDTKKVVFALRAAVVEMDRRLKLFARVGCRNIVDFNTRKTVTQPDMFGAGDEIVGGDPDTPRTVPYIVIIIDEVADIMQAAKKEVEPVIARLTALARATGIHLILATQRPDANIITGVIKSNIPGRIAFKTSSSIDSRTILDATGSELLIGKGDMLFKMSDGRLLRAQGSYISDEEINNIVNFIGEHSNVQFDEKLTKRLEKIKEADPNEGLDEDEGGDETGSESTLPADPLAAPTANGMPAPAGMTQSKEDTLYRRALEVLRDTKRASISHFQRRMGIGYNHAARIVDLLEERGVIGNSKGAGPREILLDPEAILAQMDGAPAPLPAEPVSPEPPAAAISPQDSSSNPPIDDPFGFPPEG